MLFRSYLDMHGEFSVDRDGRGPWMRLRLADGQTHTTGLSASEILSGDPRVSALVLVAVLDHGLHQPEARSRDALASVDAALTLFRQAGDAIRRQQRAATLAADAD